MGKKNKSNEHQKTIKVFYCLPMSGRTTDDICSQISSECVKIIELVKAISGGKTKIEILCNYRASDDDITFSPETTNPNMYFLGRGLMEYLSKTDIVVFGKNWEKARGCLVEHFICETYGIKYFCI